MKIKYYYYWVKGERDYAVHKTKKKLINILGLKAYNFTRKLCFKYCICRCTESKLI